MRKLVVFGAGQTAEILCYYFKNDSDFQVVAFSVDGAHLKEERFHGLPVVPFETVECEFPAADHFMHVALSYTNLNGLREEKYSAARAKGYRLASYISSRAGVVGKIEHGENCVVLENQLIQPYARLGNNVAVWSGALIGHHSVVRDHAWITSGAAIGGNCDIGERCFLGLNATVGHLVTLGHECFLGAHALVTKSAPDYSVFIEKDTERFALDSRRFMQITRMR